MTHIEYRKDLGSGYAEHIDSRAGYIGPIRIPLKAALALITWEVRIGHAWKRTFRPHLLHPQELTGYDGEPPYHLRADLAKTPHDVREYWLNQWMGPRRTTSGDRAADVAAAKEELAELREHLYALVVAYPAPVDRETLAARAGVSPLSSGFRANVSTLSSFGMLTYPAPGWVRAADLLFLGDAVPA